MDPISDRLSRAESRLQSLTLSAQELTLEFKEIRRIATYQEPAAHEFDAPPSKLILPPPLPVEASVPPPVATTPLPTIQLSTAPLSPAAKRDHASLEMQMGRVWFVRLGIVLLTTGLVFLSRYTYDNFVRDLGPGIRLTFLYLFAFALSGTGLFCERWKDSLKSYGRIVAAGGFAAIYYASFAAHNVDALRVVESPVLASLLLTASAGLFCVISLRRESRVMLATSLGLAFYSISVNPIGWMACLSAMILATLGVVMMIRYRWTEIGFVVLVGSYASYFWWQIASGSGTDTSHWFLPAYWVLFVGASLFATRDLSEKRHALFTSINHGALFLLFPLNLQTGKFMPHFWLFTLILGTAILTLGLLAQGRFPRKTTLLHFAKGVGLITLGISLKLSGYQLFVSLLIEGLILMAVHFKYPHRYTRGAAWLLCLLSLLTLSGFEHAGLPAALWLIGTAGWLLMAWLERAAESNPETVRPHLPALGASLISGAIFIGGFMGDWTSGQVAATLAALGGITSALLFSPTVRKQVFDSLWIFALLGLLAPLGLMDRSQSPTLLLALATLALSGAIIHFFLGRQNKNSDEEVTHHFFEGLHLAFAIVLTITAIHLSAIHPTAKMLLPLFIPVAGTLMAVRTNSLSHSSIPFLAYISIPVLIVWEGLPLFLAFALCLTHFVLVKRKCPLPVRQFFEPALLFLTFFFWGTSVVVGLDHPAIILTWTSIAVLLLAPWQGKTLTSILAFPFFITGLTGAWLTNESLHLYTSLIAPIVFHLWQSSRRKENNYPLMAIASLLVFWGQLTRDLGQHHPAALWAILGTLILLTGLLTKSRCFRLMALIILALSLGHIMIFDIVKLEPLPRILSFMTLGFGLLGLGFVYNRWQDRLKQML